MLNKQLDVNWRDNTDAQGRDKNNQGGREQFTATHQALWTEMRAVSFTLIAFLWTRMTRVQHDHTTPHDSALRILACVWEGGGLRGIVLKSFQGS